MPKAILILLITIAIELSLTSCPKSKKFRNSWHTNVTLTAFDNSGLTEQPLLSDSIYFKAFEFSVVIEDTVQQLAINDCNSFISSAHAFKKADRIHHLDTIIEFNIKSLQKFNSKFDAGSDLNYLFYDINGSHQEPKTNSPAVKYYLFDYPDSAAIQQFYIQLKLSDGRILSDTLKPIKFLK